MEKQYSKTACPCGSKMQFGSCCGKNSGTDYIDLMAAVKNYAVPGPLYRIFKEKEHADDFYEGKSKDKHAGKLPQSRK